MDGDGAAAGSSAAQGDWDTEFIHPVDTSTQVIIESYQKTASCVAGRYLKGAVLGEGSYGKVKEMLDVLSLNRRAVKILSKRRLRRIPSGETNVEREIQLLRQLTHEHVVKLIEVIYNEEKLKIYMVMEYCVCPLEELIKSSKDQRFPLQQAHNYFCQTVKGMEYLHSQRVVHKDIKPDNLLLSQENVVKICDFGVAERLDLFSNDDSIVTSQGSPVFQPPEVSLGHETMSGFKLDVWAAGVTLYHFVSGSYPFMGDTIFQLFETISKGEYEMPAGLSEPLTDLIRGMLEYDATKRLGVQRIMKHPWFLSAHPLQKKEVWIPIPPLCDFEHDPLRGLTCIDALMSLHQHNLPTSPLYLTEDHIAHLMGNRGAMHASVSPSSQDVPATDPTSVTTGSVSSQDHQGSQHGSQLGSQNSSQQLRQPHSISEGPRDDGADRGSPRGNDVDSGGESASRRRAFFRTKGHSSSDMSNVSQLSGAGGHRFSDTSTPPHSSNATKKSSINSQAEILPAARRALHSSLSPNEEEEAVGADTPDASQRPQSKSLEADYLPAEDARSGHKQPSTSATLPVRQSTHPALRRMRKAVQCRQQ